MTPHHPDTTPPVEQLGTALDDPADVIGSAFGVPPSAREPAIDPRLATPAFVAPRRRQRRASRGPAARLMALARGLWIIIRERVK